jgi:PleD family two-component response regulator
LLHDINHLSAFVKPCEIPARPTATTVTFLPMNTLNTQCTRKILVVDDDPRLRDLLRRYLTEQGFNVLTAEDAREMNKIWQR